MTVRDNVTVTVRNTMSGAKRVSTRKKSEKPATVQHKFIHPAVLAEALKITGGDYKRLTIVSETEIRID